MPDAASRAYSGIIVHPAQRARQTLICREDYGAGFNGRAQLLEYCVLLQVFTVTRIGV